MGLAQLLRPTSHSRAVRDPGWNRWAAGDDIGYGSVSESGMRVTRETSLQLLTVYGCQALISDNIAMMPRDVYRKRAGVREEVTPPAWIAGQANAENTTDQLVQQIILSLLQDGNAFLPIVRDRAGSVLEVWCLDPQRVQVLRRQGNVRRVVYIVDGVEYAGELVQLTWFLLPGAIRALNPIQGAAVQAIGLGQAAQQFGSSFFKNGSVPATVIEHPGDPTDEQLRDMASSFRRSHTGKNALMPAIVTGGGKINALTIAPEHAQFLETRAYSAAEIAAQLYRVNPARLGIVQSGTTVTYQNTEQRGIELVRDTLMPWMDRVEKCFSYLLPRPQYMKFNADIHMRADLKGRYEAYQIGINSGFLLKDEARATEDLPPLPGGAGSKPAEPVAAPPVQQQLPLGGMQ